MSAAELPMRFRSPPLRVKFAAPSRPVALPAELSSVTAALLMVTVETARLPAPARRKVPPFTLSGLAAAVVRLPPAGEGERAGPQLGQEHSAGALRDRSRQGDVEAVGVDHSGAGEADRPRGSEGRRRLQGLAAVAGSAAVEGEGGGGIAERGIGGDVDDSVGEDGAAGVVVGAGQHEAAGDSFSSGPAPPMALESVSVVPDVATLIEP